MKVLSTTALSQHGPTPLMLPHLEAMPFRLKGVTGVLAVPIRVGDRQTTVPVAIANTSTTNRQVMIASIGHPTIRARTGPPRGP